MKHVNNLPKFQFPLDFNEVVGDLETRLIQSALEETGGIMCKAAILLGLRRTTFVEKVRKMRGIQYKKRNKDIRKSDLWAT